MKYIYLIIVVCFIMPISVHAESIDWYLESLWYSDESVKAIIDECNNSRNITWCQKSISSIWKQESWAGKSIKNLLWMMIKWVNNMSESEQIKLWVDKYDKYWYKHNTATAFIQKSKYCTEEPWHAKGSWCPNRQRNVQKYMNKYDSEVNNEITDDPVDETTDITNDEPIKVCRQIYTAQEWDYIQIDSLRGQFKKWIGIEWWDKIFVCN